MARYHVFAGIGTIGALIITPVAQAQAPAAGAAQPGDLELSCSGLAVEMGKAAQQLAQTAATPATAPTAVAQTTGNSQLEAIGRAYQQQQNAQQLANLQVLAARGGVNAGTAGAAIGGLAALQQVATNGGNASDAVRSVATDKVSGELAKRLPGGALLGGMMGGMFKKKPKPVAGAAAAAPAPASSAAQGRLAFLGSVMTAKGCK